MNQAGPIVCSVVFYVLFDLTELELEVFDMFEDIEYMRMVTTPILLVCP
jgi:hypothetical protein